MVYYNAGCFDVIVVVVVVQRSILSK